MIDNVLILKKLGIKARVSIKIAIAVGLSALGVGLPRLVHYLAGAQGGVKWLPMYLPVLLSGALLGVWWGLGVALTTPVISFALTSATGKAMPALEYLPFIMMELAVFATVAGAFSKKIPSNTWLAFPAAILAALAGRTVFVLVAAVCGPLSPVSAAEAFERVQAGALAVVLQSVIVPFAVMGLSLLCKASKKE